MNKTLPQKRTVAWISVWVLLLCMQGCSSGNKPVLGQIKVPPVASDRGAGIRSLEVPPELDSPEVKGVYDVTSAQQHAGGVEADASTTETETERVLPQHLDMHLRSEGALVWLVVSATPDDLWPHLIEFWESHGFEIANANGLRGRIEVDWREQRADDATGEVRTRDKFLMRVERGPDAVTNIYLANRKATFTDEGWGIAFSDRETEVEILHDVRDYLADRREVESLSMPPLQSVRIKLGIKDFEGTPVLAIGQSYARVWRRLGVTLDRAGLDVRNADRSRGIYLISYERAEAEPRLLQLRLRESKDKILVTVHANGKQDEALAYETEHEVLHRIVRAYQVQA